MDRRESQADHTPVADGGLGAVNSPWASRRMVVVVVVMLRG